MIFHWGFGEFYKTETVKPSPHNGIRRAVYGFELKRLKIGVVLSEWKMAFYHIKMQRYENGSQSCVYPCHVNPKTGAC